MKRIFCYILAVLAVSACMISHCEMPSVSDSDLRNYGSRLFAKNVCVPLNMMELAQAFDKYLLLSDEEKENDGRFYNRISILGNNVYEITDCKSSVKCVIDTHGKSLSAEGGVWDIVEPHVRVEISQLQNYYNYNFDFDFDEEFAISMSGGNFEYRTVNNAHSSNTLEMTISAAAQDVEEVEFMIALAGSERTDSFGSEFSVDSPMAVRKNNMNGMWIFDGTFRFSTYRIVDNKELDDCSFVFKPGYLAGFNANR